MKHFHLISTLFFVYQGISLIAGLRPDQLQGGTVKMVPELNPGTNNSCDLYVEHLYSQPNDPIQQIFGEPNETLSNLANLFTVQTYSTASWNNAFIALNITVDQVQQAAHVCNRSLPFLKAVGMLPRGMLARVNARVNNYTVMADLTVNFNLSSRIMVLAFQKTDAEMYTALTFANFTDYNLSNLWGTLNYSTVVDFVNNWGFAVKMIKTFTKYNFDDVRLLLAAFGVPKANMHAACRALQPGTYLTKYTIIGRIPKFLNTTIGVGSLTSQTQILTHRLSVYGMIANSLSQYISLYAVQNTTRALINLGGQVSGYTIQISTVNGTKMGSYAFQTTQTYTANSYSQCNFAYFVNNTDGTQSIQFAAVSAAYDPNNHTLVVLRNAAPNMTDGSGLICSDSLYAVGAISRETNDYYVFDAIASFVKVINPAQPVADTGTMGIDYVFSISSFASNPAGLLAMINIQNVTTGLQNMLGLATLTSGLPALGALTALTAGVPFLSGVTAILGTNNPLAVVTSLAGLLNGGGLGGLTALSSLGGLNSLTGLTGLSAISGITGGVGGLGGLTSVTSGLSGIPGLSILTGGLGGLNPTQLTQILNGGGPLALLLGLLNGGSLNAITGVLSGGNPLALLSGGGLSSVTGLLGGGGLSAVTGVLGGGGLTSVTGVLSGGGLTSVTGLLSGGGLTTVTGILGGGNPLSSLLGSGGNPLGIVMSLLTGAGPTSALTGLVGGSTIISSVIPTSVLTTFGGNVAGSATAALANVAGSNGVLGATSKLVDSIAAGGAALNTFTNIFGKK